MYTHEAPRTNGVGNINEHLDVGMESFELSLEELGEKIIRLEEVLLSLKNDPSLKADAAELERIIANLKARAATM